MAVVQAAATGRSLIGKTSITITIGLVATSQAAMTPQVGPRRRRAIPNVASTRRPAENGTTRKRVSALAAQGEFGAGHEERRRPGAQVGACA